MTARDNLANARSRDAASYRMYYGTPSALMEWPNGDRTLLVLKR